LTYQYRELSRFNPDGDDMRYGPPSSEAPRRCRMCERRIDSGEYCAECDEDFNGEAID
jgi:hypothetical protein